VECSAIAEQAKEIVRINGYADRITIIHKKLEDMELPVEKVGSYHFFPALCCAAQLPPPPLCITSCNVYLWGRFVYRLITRSSSHALSIA
jgi:hypothetical protein